MASLRLGVLPESWKIANVVAVSKPGRDPFSPSSYRPISLLPTLSKLLERIITDRLTHYLETHQLLDPYQYGFRQGRGTEEALWHLISVASAALQHRQRLTLVSLDIQGAYDTVWHSGLLWKLKQLGVPADLTRWIAAFLTPRTAHLHVRCGVASRHLAMGVPQGSPLSPVLFLVYVNDLITQLCSIDNAFAQAFANDLVSWWLDSAQSSQSSSPSPQISQCIQFWASQWRMVFNPAKCQLLVIGCTSTAPPSFTLGGSELTHVPHLRYLGVWLDSSLSWNEHIRRVSQWALDRLRLLHRGVGTLWGFHPMILRRLIEAVVLPTLFYAAPVWCTAVCHLSRLAPLDRVIRHCAIAIFGLLRTVSHEAAQMLVGLLPAEFQLRRRLMEFYLRRLTYSEDLSTALILPPLNRTVSPLDILRQELRHMERTTSLSTSQFCTVEPHRLWLTAPSSPRASFSLSIPDRETALHQIRSARVTCSSTDLWVFTDGSIDGLLGGAAAVCFVGSSLTPFTFSVHFMGLHSSTQAELVALRLGCRHVPDLGTFQRVTFVTDSQAALLSLRHSRRCLALTAEVQSALRELSSSGLEIRLWWTPGHSSLMENDLVDAAAKAAAHGPSTEALLEAVPSCHSCLRTAICHHYVTRLERQWHMADTGRDLHAIMPSFSRCLRWTVGLSRRQVALTAQFLTGHYATNAYLCRFGSRSDPACGWCSAPTDDRAHRLFHYPRFSSLRLQLSMEVAAVTNGTQAWSWDFLVGRGRSFLARFLDPVHATPQPIDDDAL